MHPSEDHIRSDTLRWIERTVIGHNLCPFAKPVFEKTRLTIYPDASLSGLLSCLGDEIIRLMETSSDVLPTSIIVAPEGLSSFDRYLDVLGMLEALVEDIGCGDEIQIASFHPQYVFEGSPIDDPANWTNRSPYPMFHFLRTAEVAQAIESHPDVDGIPERNMTLFRRLGAQRVQAELADCYSEDSSSTN